MGRRQVSGQQNVSYSTGTRRETWSHVTTSKLTVAYAAQTVSNFGANREFRTSICLGDTAWEIGRCVGTNFFDGCMSNHLQLDSGISMVPLLLGCSSYRFNPLK